MTVLLEGIKKRWICVAADTKPETATEGSEVHEIDTGKKFVFHDGSWLEDKRTV